MIVSAVAPRRASFTAVPSCSLLSPPAPEEHDARRSTGGRRRGDEVALDPVVAASVGELLDDDPVLRSACPLYLQRRVRVVAQRLVGGGSAAPGEEGDEDGREGDGAHRRGYARPMAPELPDHLERATSFGSVADSGTSAHGRDIRRMACGGSWARPRATSRTSGRGPAS